MKLFCLTIAGSDPTCGAGIQADIRTFDRCGVHPFSVISISNRFLWIQISFRRFK